MRLVDKLVQKLEKYRKANGLTKADMARLVGANSNQQYNNWVYRGSLPKEFYTRVATILGTDGELSRIDAEIISKIEQLPEAKAALVLQMIDSLLGDPEAE